MKSSKQNEMRFSFRDIITRLIFSNNTTKAKSFPYVKDIFNAIFGVDSETNTLTITANEQYLQKNMDYLLRHAVHGRLQQVKLLDALSEFWERHMFNYNVDDVNKNISNILKETNISYKPSNSNFDKFFDFLASSEYCDIIGQDTKIILEMRKGDAPFNHRNYSQEAFVYLLVSSLYLNKSEMPEDISKKRRNASASFGEYLKNRKKEISEIDAAPTLLSPAVYAEMHNKEISLRKRLELVAEQQLNTAAKYAGRLSALSHKSVENLPVIQVSVLNEKNDNISLSDLIITHELKKARLVGIGGSGKSCFLITLGNNLTNSNVIPLYIPMNELHGKSIAEYITGLLDAEYTEITDNRTAVRDFLNGELGLTSVLLLDGFNEITDSEERSRIAKELRDISQELIVVITSRYEITELYDIESYEKLTISPISVETAEKFINESVPGYSSEIMDMISDFSTEGKRTLLPFISTPMALVLLVTVYKQKNNELIHERVENIGQLIENYIQCISCCSRESFFCNETIDKLAYTGLNMSVIGSYEIDSGSCLCGYIKNTAHTDKAQFFSSSLLKSFTTQDNGKVSFIHQNFRDGFAALYLHSVLLFGDSGEINRFFELNISSDVKKLLADMISGSDCIKKQLSKNFDSLSAQCVGTLISVAAAAEDDLSGYDLSELDLTASSLNSTKLYNKANGSIANLSHSRINLSTISASGHTGKIDALLFLINRFIVSFAKDSFYCFDMELKKQYILVYCESSPITDAIKFSDDTVVVNHTSGLLNVYKYYIKDDRLYFEMTDALDHSTPKSHSIVLFGNRVYGAYYDGTIFSFGITGHKISGHVPEEYKYNAENRSSDALNFHTGPRLAVWGEKLCACFGNRLTVFKTENDKLTLLLQKEESYDSDIHDMIVFDEHLFLNVRTRVNTLIAVYDGRMKRISSSPKEHNHSFFGIDRFAISPGGLYAAVNIEDSAFQAGVWKILLSTNGVETSSCFGTRHTMPVNVCLPFRYKKQDYIATGSTDRSVEILKEKNNELSLIHNFPGHYEGIHSFCMNDNGDLLTAQYSGEISLWKSTDSGWKCDESWKHHDWAWHVRCIKLNKKYYIISCSYDHTIIVYNLTDHKLLLNPIKFDSRITTLGVIPDDSMIKIICGISKTVNPSTEMNVVQTTVSIPKSPKAGNNHIVSTQKIRSNATISELPSNMQIRCVEFYNGRTVICFGDRRSSRVFDYTGTSVTEIQNDYFKNIGIRCISFMGNVNVYGGDDPKGSGGKVLLV